MARIDHTTNCCVCGRIIDKRERDEGGDSFGAQLNDGRWACSIDCWEIAVNGPADWLEDRAIKLDELLGRRSLVSRQGAIYAALREAIASAVEAERERMKQINLTASCFKVGCQAWTLLAEIKAAEAKLARLANPDEALVEAVARALAGERNEWWPTWVKAAERGIHALAVILAGQEGENT